MVKLRKRKGAHSTPDKSAKKTCLKDGTEELKKSLDQAGNAATVAGKANGAKSGVGDTINSMTRQRRLYVGAILSSLILPNCSRQFCILKLPPELRLKIYSILLPETSLPEADFDNAIRHWKIFWKHSNFVVYKEGRASCDCNPYQHKVCARIMQRTNLWEDMRRMREQNNDLTILSTTSMKRFNYRASTKNPLIGLMLTCRQIHKETLGYLLSTYLFYIQYDGGILRNLGFQDEIVHPFLWSKDVLPRIRKLTLFVRFFRPSDRSSRLYKFSPQFHYYSALRKSTGLSSIRICISYVCVPDDDYNLQYIRYWDEQDRI